MTLYHKELYTELKPLMIEWDLRMPPNTSVHKWRRAQLARYLDEHPQHKPSNFML